MKNVILSLVIALGLLTACAGQQKPSGRIDNTVEAEATVIDINKEQRLVALEDANGKVIVVEASDAVKNLDEVEIGDVVKVSYTEALAWAVKKSSAGSTRVTADADVKTAQPGEKPGGTARQSVTITAAVSAIDLSTGTVTLVGPQGKSRTIKAENPDNLRKVRVGDLVDITYSEALALSVRPVAKK